MITGIDHVQITILAPGRGNGSRFYCRLLGLKEIRNPSV